MQLQLVSPRAYAVGNHVVIGDSCYRFAIKEKLQIIRIFGTIASNKSGVIEVSIASIVRKQGFAWQRSALPFGEGLAAPADPQHAHSNSHEHNMRMRTTTTNPLGSEPAGSGRMVFLDALRGLAALAVFISHAAERVSPTLREIVHTRFDLGHFGVTLFFLCSGFIIPFSLERQNSLSSFWISRIFRLYPLYWFTIGVSVFLAFTQSAGRSFSAFLFTNSSMILGNLTMFQLFLGIPQMRGEYWTLSFEMLFYIIMSALFLLRINRYTFQFTLGLIVLSLLVEGLLPLMFGAQFPVGILSFLALMFMGTTIYRVYNGELSARAGLAVEVFGFMMLFITPLSKGISEDGAWQYLNLISARLAAVIVFGMVFLVRSYRPSRFMLYLGMISYSLYLMQTYVMIIDVHNSALNVLFWIVAQLVVATATYHWIERPGIALGRRLHRWSATYRARE